MAAVAIIRCKPGPAHHTPDLRRDEPRTSSFEDIAEHVADEFTLYGRDPFDIVAALEEELGYPIHDS